MTKPVMLVLMLIALATMAVAQHDHDDGMDHEHDGSYFDSGTEQDDWLMNNDSYEFTFDITHGTFEYHCHPHPWMRGNITVEGEAMEHEDGDDMAMEDGDSMATGTVHTVRILEGEDVGDTSAYRYEPENLTVQIGDTVRWVNEGQLGHTVTAIDPEPSTHSHDTPAVGIIGLLAAVGAAAVAVRRK